jgi:lysyl-tRNA synthetase class II
LKCPVLEFKVEIDQQSARGSDVIAILTEALVERIKEDPTFVCEYPPQFYLCKDRRIERTLEDYIPLSVVENEKYDIVAMEG